MKTYEIVAPLSRAGRGLKPFQFVVSCCASRCRPALTSGARIETSFCFCVGFTDCRRPALTSGARIETASRISSFVPTLSPRSHERGAD